jgi:class 3 adenylate cyclase
MCFFYRVVYAMFASQYHISSILLSVIGTRSTHILPYMAISLVLFTASGFALSVITICSQACVLQACGACVPEDLEAQFMQHKVCGSDVTTDSFGPPEHHPVFVYTDIESSSALWALAADGVMDKATDIHDNIIRSSLPRHDGYEITTCGDSFQLAFPTIQDAVAFCVDVQLQLLVAPWPKELHGLVPATKRQRSGHRLIFSGLRVRMGIHDSVDEDGVLVCERHAITGNMTYTGASEAIAGEVSELGRGGQILVTQRVAEWVQLHSDEMDVDLMVEYLDHYCMRVLEAEKPVYQIVPSILIGRRKYWPIPPQPMRSTLWSVSCVGTSPSVTTTTASLAPRSRSFPEIVIPTPPTPANTPKLHKSTSLMRISLDAIPESPVFVTNYVAWPSTK